MRNKFKCEKKMHFHTIIKQPSYSIWIFHMHVSSSSSSSSSSSYPRSHGEHRKSTIYVRNIIISRKIEFFLGSLSKKSFCGHIAKISKFKQKVLFLKSFWKNCLVHMSKNISISRKITCVNVSSWKETILRNIFKKVKLNWFSCLTPL